MDDTMSNETMDKTKYYVESAYAFYNDNNQPVYHQCEDIHVWFEKYPDWKRCERRCGGDSMHLITWYARLSEKWMSKHICDLCLSHYIERYGLDNFIFSE